MARQVTKVTISLTLPPLPGREKRKTPLRPQLISNPLPPKTSISESALISCPKNAQQTIVILPTKRTGRRLLQEEVPARIPSPWQMPGRDGCNYMETDEVTLTFTLWLALAPAFTETAVTPKLLSKPLLASKAVSESAWEPLPPTMSLLSVTEASSA